MAAHRTKEEIQDHIDTLHTENERSQGVIDHPSSTPYAKQWHIQKIKDNLNWIKQLTLDLRFHHLRNLEEAGDPDHVVWEKTAQLALDNASEAARNGDHGTAQKLRKAADDFIKKSQETKEKLKHYTSLIEGEVGYDNLDNQGKHDFHEKSMDQISHIAMRTDDPEVHASLIDDWQHHFNKLMAFKKLLGMGIKDM